MLRLSFLLLLSMAISTSRSQTFEWVKTEEIDYEFNPGMIQYATCTDLDGNIYFFGLQEHLITYIQPMGTHFVKKYNPSGALIWENFIEGEALAEGIYCDNSGNIFLYGQLHSDLNFWEQLIINYDGNSTNSYLVRLTIDGMVNWGINLEDLPFGSGVISDIVCDGSGVVYAGYSTGLNAYIIKINDSGVFTDMIVHEDVSLISGIDVDQNGNIFASGSCAGFNSSFGGINFPAPFNYSTYIVKYNSDDEPEWVKFIEDITCTHIKVQCDNSGGAYVAGQIYAETTLDTIIVHGATWVYDFFLTRLSPAGEFQWILECPEVLTGDASTGQLQFLNTDSEGNALLAGFTRGTINWGNGIVSSSSGFSQNIIVWNVSQNGEINWLKTAGGEGFDNAHSISSAPDGDIYLTGIAGGTSIFDTITCVSDDFVYPFLAKIQVPALTDINKIELTSAPFVFPNPVKNRIYFRSGEFVRYAIFNSQGSIITEGMLKETTNYVDLPGIRTGIYFMRFKMKSTGQDKTGKIVVRH